MGKYGQEEHNMSSEIFSPKPSDNLGNKGYLPETAQARPPTLPTRRPMPKPPIDFPKRPEITPPPEPSRKALYARLAGTLLIAIATAGPAIDHHMQNETAITPDAIGRDALSIPDFYSGLISKLTRKEPTPNFDNTVDNGTISTINSVVIHDLKEIEAIPTVPSGPNPKHDINLLMPIQGISPSGTIDYNKDLIGKNDANPIFAEQSRKYAKEQDVKNSIIFRNIPKDSVIVAPIDGELDFSKFSQEDSLIAMARLFYKDSNGILQQVMISGTSHDFFSQLAKAEPLPLGKGFVSFEEGSKFRVSVKRGQPIMKTVKNTDIKLSAMAWPSGAAGREISKNGEHLYPTNLNLITLDLPSGANKLVVVEK